MLEQQRTSSATATAQLQEPRAARRRLVIALIATLLVALAVWRALIAAGVFNTKTIPDELLGMWTTTAPAYADRALEFTPTSVYFYVGDEGVSVHRVYRVGRTAYKSHTAYIVEYLDGDRVASLSFHYIASPRQLIRLANEQFVWRRQPTK